MPSLTLTGFVGSPYYISPEQAKGEQVDIRSDIYSLGIVISRCSPAGSLSTPTTVGDYQPTYRKRTAISMRLGCRDSTRGWRPRAHRQSKAPEARFQTPLLMLEAIDAMLAKTHDIPETESPTSADLREKLRADTNREQKQPSTEIGHRRSRHSRM